MFFPFIQSRTETVRLLLETHPELVGPYTAYGGAMYTHTPLHLASRNGHRYNLQSWNILNFASLTNLILL